MCNMPIGSAAREFKAGTDFYSARKIDELIAYDVLDGFIKAFMVNLWVRIVIYQIFEFVYI